MTSDDLIEAVKGENTTEYAAWLKALLRQFSQEASKPAKVTLTVATTYSKYGLQLGCALKENVAEGEQESGADMDATYDVPLLPPQPRLPMSEEEDIVKAAEAWLAEKG